MGLRNDTPDIREEGDEKEKVKETTREWDKENEEKGGEEGKEGYR